MASGGDTNAENSVVRYSTTNDPESVQVDVQSPAKNRYKGTSLTQRKHRKGPVLFERASGSWWNPKFDSKVLEEQLWKSYFPQTRRRFQYALIYIVAACVAWMIFFGAMRERFWAHFLPGTGVLLVISVLMMIFTRTRFYERFYLLTSVIFVVVLASLLLASFAFHPSDLSSVGSFSGSVEILLLIYTFIPLPLFGAVLIGVCYSILYEILVAIREPEMQEVNFICAKFLLHLCIHLIGIHIFIMSQVRRRSTFWKIGQSVIARRDLEVEKQLKEKMIHSLMPPSVAADVMRCREDKEEEDMGDGRVKKRTKSKRDKGEIIFRPFNMSQMENVSILFADIVGFTKMSSNKTAEHLVGLLNDLFGRFDNLCTNSGCEKISTLGDCYYCVSGCPKPRPDHAMCCVEMGLGMIKAIKEFDEENNEQVNMRVGVHTGTVLCGIVGTRRFKFDVWSNDVTLANIMESTGKPGMVHISEVSYQFLKDEFEVEEGEEVEDMNTNKVLIEHYDITKSSFTIRHTEDLKVIKTYFILGRKKKEPSPDADVRASQSQNSVAINIDGENLDDKVKPKADSSSGGDHSGANASNHLDRESSEVNGISPAALLGRRHSSGFFAASSTSLDRIVDEGKSTNISPSSKLSTNCQKGIKADQESVAKPCSMPHPTLNNNISSHCACKTPKLRLKNKTNGNIGLVQDKDDPSAVPINEAWTKMRMIQDQTDKQIIKCLKEDITNKEFFYEPPINKCTLSFLSDNLEEDFRDHYLDSHLFKEETVASPRYHALLEIIVSLFVFTLISICCFMMFPIHLPWLVVFVIILLIEIFVLIQVVTDVKFGKEKKERCEPLMHVVSGWYFRNFIGALTASLPAIAVYSNLSCEMVFDSEWHDRFFCFCVVVALLHFCNFTMLSSWVKSIIAAIAGIALLVLLSLKICPFNAPGVVPSTVTSINTTVGTEYNISGTKMPVSDYLFSGESIRQFEIILDLILLLLLIVFMNREFEISYRLSFHGSAQSEADKKQMQENKDQADWLLHNIIPQHVSEQVKKTSKYSKNHKDCGVIFATIVNFNEFYDESYEGGREYLRVLNELVSDYEVLLDKECYKDVEKIKTISSTFMAASGLNEQTRMQNKHPHAHLFALMSFAMDMQKAVEHFNESIFNFDFVMNIGFNYGEVTAGVIGTTKLLYDIWGDTVNIASRMYSTGKPDRIQVPEASAVLLGDCFEFEYRGEIFVKGKGQMKTFLVVKKKDGAHWD